MKIIDSAVAVSVESASSRRLYLSDVFKLKSSLPRQKFNSDAELLRACHRRLHGSECSVPNCVASTGRIGEQHRLPFSHLMKSSSVTSAKKTASKTAAIDFDFVNGVWLFIPPTTDDNALPPPSSFDVVRVRLRGKAAATPRTALQPLPSIPA